MQQRCGGSHKVEPPASSPIIFLRSLQCFGRFFMIKRTVGIMDAVRHNTVDLVHCRKAPVRESIRISECIYRLIRIGRREYRRGSESGKRQGRNQNSAHGAPVGSYQMRQRPQTWVDPWPRQSATQKPRTAAPGLPDEVIIASRRCRLPVQQPREGKPALSGGAGNGFEGRERAGGDVAARVSAHAALKAEEAGEQ